MVKSSDFMHGSSHKITYINQFTPVFNPINNLSTFYNITLTGGTIKIKFESIFDKI